MSKKKTSARSRTRAGGTRRAPSATKGAAPRTARKALAQVDEESHIDGCELDFTQDVTPDSELPPATGGVAPMGRKARRT